MSDTDVPLTQGTTIARAAVLTTARIPVGTPPDRDLLAGEAADHDVLVLVDEAGRPLQALRRRDWNPLADPDAQTWQPILVLPGECEVDRWLGSSSATLLDLMPELAVAVSDGAVLGALPVSVLEDRLAEQESVLAPTMMSGPHGSTSDAELLGQTQTGLAVVQCAQPRCGTFNRLAFYDPRRPPLCANPAEPRHALVVPGR